MEQNWYIKYGWKRNPFNIKPFTKLVGLDAQKRKLVDYIQGGEICFLTGPPGTGKSSLLRWVVEDLRRSNNIYINAKGVNEFFEFEKYLKKKAGVLRRIFRRYPKNVVLLLDEAQHCSERFISDIESLWDQDIITSIIISQIDEDYANYPDSFKERMGKRIIRTDRLTSSDAHELVNIRTENKHPFEKEALDLIIKDAKFIPRKILENCSTVCIELGYSKNITVEDVKKVFAERKENLVKQKLAKLEYKEPSYLTVMDRLDNSGEFSPMQARIIKLLMDGDKSSQQLALILDTSLGSVGKQLSKLMAGGYVEIVSHRRPKRYGLCKTFINELKSDLN